MGRAMEYRAERLLVEFPEKSSDAGNLPLMAMLAVVHDIHPLGAKDLRSRAAILIEHRDALEQVAVANDERHVYGVGPRMVTLMIFHLFNLILQND